MILFFFLIWFDTLCPHGSLVDRYEKARMAPPANIRILSVTEDKVDLEFVDTRQRKLIGLDYNKATIMDKDFKEKKDGKYIVIYCGEHFYLYQAEKLK